LTSPHEIRNAFTVPFEYRVIFSDGVFAAANPLVADLLSTGASALPARAVVFLDQGLHNADHDVLPAVSAYFAAHPARVRLAADVQVIAGGEGSKRGSEIYDHCVQVLHDAKLDRHSYMIAIGGGAMLDAACFAASTVHRGVRQVRVPTTVLGQNDAGIGVKNGIDYLGKKNFLGSFYPPFAVVNDFTLLRTLPATEWRNGSAEAVKVGLIRDGAFFDWIEERADRIAHHDQEPMRHLIRRCAELHLRQITTGGDPFERGSARPLDFGHWSAHKLEQLSGFTIRHGHAVAVGMAIDTLYSSRTGLLPTADARRVTECLRRLGFRFDVGAKAGIRSAADLGPLLAGIEEFQEHLGGRLSVTMLTGIGSAVEIDRFDLPVLNACATDVLLGGA
jgi:3-dehydroquinate synthase